MANKKSVNKIIKKTAKKTVKNNAKKNIKTNIKEILKSLSKAKNITIIGHRNPDVDCICSCLGLSLLLKKYSKREKFSLSIRIKCKEIYKMFY